MEQIRNIIFGFKLSICIFAVIVIISVLFLFLVIPLLIYRYFVILCSKFLTKFKGGRIVTGASAFLAADNIYNVPNYNLVIILPMEFMISPDRFKQKLIQVLEEKNDKGELVNRKMCQTVTRFMGYNFWIQDSEFNINSHFKIRDENITSEKLEELERILALKSWKPGHPLWEFTILNNFIDSKLEVSTPTSVIILTAHHALSDGYGLLYLLQQKLNDNPPEILSAKPSTVLKSTNPVTLFFKSVYDKSCELAQPSQSIPWKLRKELRIVDEFVSGELDVNTLKSIRHRYNVSLTAVILTGITKAIRKIILDNNKKVPESFGWITIMLKGNRPEYFTNHAQMYAVPLPTSIENSEARLMKVEKEYNRILTSTTPSTDFHIGNIMCSLLPNVILKKIMRTNPPYLGGISSFPWGPDVFSMAGVNVRDIRVRGRRVLGCGISFICISYKGKMEIRVGVDQSIGNLQTSERLLKYFNEEINILTLLQSDLIV